MMDIPYLRTSRSYCCPRVSIILILLAIHPLRILAQTSNPSDNPASPTRVEFPAAPSLLLNPTNGDAVAAATTNGFPSVPPSTDGAGYGKTNGTSTDKGILNYYFLLLAVFIIVLALVYWVFARKRRNRMNSTRDNQQSALAMDLNSWPLRRRGNRWRHNGHMQTRAEEGLDERGEAPPPYLKEPEPAYAEGRERVSGMNEEVELHDMSRQEAKPPDYDNGPAGR